MRGSKSSLKRVAVQIEENDVISLSEGEDFEQNEGIGGKLNREKGKEKDELIEIDERPQRLHR